ncbi:restriction endonuclease subunit S [Ectopseudomonas chengduensis]
MTAETVSLSELFQIGSSKRVLKSQWQAHGVPFYRGREVTRLAIDGFVDNELFISEDHYVELANQYGVPRAGDIVITAIGTIGNAYIVQDQDRFYFKDASVLWMKKTKNVSSEFVNLWLKSPEFFDQLDRGNGATVDTLTIQKLQGVQIRIPSITEQHRIVALLDEAFDGIATAKANAENNLQNARALFESVLDSVRGNNAPLGNYVTIKTGKLDANAAVKNGAYPFFTCAKEIYAIDKYAFDCEAILLAGNNAVGDFNVKHYKGKFNAYQRTYVITTLDENRLSYRFLYFQMLKSLRQFKEQSVGAGTKFLKLGMIKELEISLPPIAEQVETALMLDSLLEETQRLELIYQQKLAALDELKQSLLHQAFSGNL